MDTQIDAVTEQLARILDPVGPLELGWRPNHGTGVPTVPPGHRLDVKYRRGNVLSGADEIAGEFRWKFIDADSDIVEYRFVPLEKTMADQSSRVYRGVALEAEALDGCPGCYFLNGDLCSLNTWEERGCIQREGPSVIWVKRKPLAAPEVDPHGKDPHAPGAKLDAGKIRPGLVLGGFARALKEVARVGTYGAQKYTENGWVLVPNGVDRYDDAMLRHWLDEHCGIDLDKDTELRHAAHAAWNALARLDLLVRQSEGGAA